MSYAPANAPMLFGDPDAESTGGLRWLSPALIGLVAPLVAGLMLVPGAIENARPAVMSLLAVLLLVCVVAYAVSVLSPSVPTGLLVDRDQGVVEIFSHGLLASRTARYAVDDVADLAVERTYDDDGYAYDVARMTLRSGESVALPVSMTAADVAAARRALGRGTVAATATARRR